MQIQVFIEYVTSHKSERSLEEIDEQNRRRKWKLYRNTLIVKIEEETTENNQRGRTDVDTNRMLKVWKQTKICQKKLRLRVNLLEYKHKICIFNINCNGYCISWELEEKYNDINIMNENSC